MNTRCAAYWEAWLGGQFVSEGPVIAFWNAINSQMESNWKKTRGAQRVRLKFVVRSDDGIADVKVRDADKGLFRRFLGKGEKELAREFECVQDQQHDLTLEVTDTKGKRAFSWVIRVYCYKQGLFRCGDNLNILGATGMCWHPDRNEMMSMAKAFENGIQHTLFGWDSAGYLCPMPNAQGEEVIVTDQGEYPQFQKHGIVGKILDVGLSSYNLQIATQRMTHLAEPFDSETRPTPALGTIPRDLGPIECYERTHTIYSPATRTDWYTSWNHRRIREGIQDYRGGIIWHEGKIRFTKDVTLEGDVPIRLARMMCPLNLEKAQGDSMVVTDASGKTRFARLVDEKKPVRITGRIRPGGYAALMPSLVGYHGFMAPAGSDFAYQAFLPGWMWIGMGKDGQKVKASTELTYQFAVGSFADSAVGNDLLEDTLSAMNFDGHTNGYPFVMKAGAFVDGRFFFTAMADKNETVLTIGPRDLIIDLPFRIKGLEDNGCVAVYSRIRPWFRFVPVVKGVAFFQEPILPANELWVGNILVCDNKDVKITVVTDGLKDGNKPFVELHNPTDKQLDVSVISPPNTPQLGGLSERVTIPAGNTCRLEISDKKLVPGKMESITFTMKRNSP
ncbi:MAG: hypothetical protein HY360_00425 [Verrucomicrobia bacterium]|nr:hypothetical protein [Verrucomicrobiota bacterium]